MIKAFALALFAASVVAQDDMATTSMDMPADMKTEDAAGEEKHGDEASIEILQALIDIVCEPAADHMSEDAKKEMMDEQGAADATTMTTAEEEMKKMEDHSAEDIEKMRNSKLCLKAREMLSDIVEYTNGDKDVRRQKAEKWGGVVYDVVQDFYGDGAASMTAYGATVIAAITLISF